jgi:hypothetical protein
MKHFNLFLGLLSYLIAGVSFLCKQYYGTGDSGNYNWIYYFVFLFMALGIFFFLKWIYVNLKGISLKNSKSEQSL